MVWSGDKSGCNSFLGVKDPVPLRHFGKREVLAKIDLIDDRYDILMRFDLDCIPANT